jgi:DNA polymerase-3 subunit epsilon
MVRAAPAASEVMRKASNFVGDAPMVAHNASFDRKFWMGELSRLGLPARQPFACTMLLSRRLYPQAPNHKLGTLVDYHRLPRTGAAHRALADAEMAAELLLRIQQDLQRRHEVADVDHDLLMALQQCQRQGVSALLSRHARV